MLVGWRLATAWETILFRLQGVEESLGWRTREAGVELLLLLLLLWIGIRSGGSVVSEEGTLLQHRHGRTIEVAGRSVGRITGAPW